MEVTKRNSRRSQEKRIPLAPYHTTRQQFEEPARGGKTTLRWHTITRTPYDYPSAAGRASQEGQQHLGGTQHKQQGHHIIIRRLHTLAVPGPHATIFLVAVVSHSHSDAASSPIQSENYEFTITLWSAILETYSCVAFIFNDDGQLC